MTRKIVNQRRHMAGMGRMLLMCFFISPVAGRNDTFHARHLTAVDVAYEVSTVDGSNVQAEPRSTVNVNVLAGVTYPAFIIQAASGLGTSKQAIRAKLVPYDMRSTLQSCQTVNAYMGFPFNGAENAVIPGQTPETIRNVFGPLTFPNGGLFRLCYSPDGIQWQELEPSISVLGAESTSNKIWCPVTSLRRAECKTVQPPPIGCECTGKVQGYKRNNLTDEFMLTGLPNPAYPPWRSSLTYVNEACGNSDAAPFVDKVSNVQNEIGYEIHNFGLLKDGFNLGVWKVCYCAGFDFDNGAADGGIVTVCSNAAPQDFRQEIGRLIVINVESLIGQAGSRDITVYPTLRFGLVINCGHDGVLNKEPDSVSGGCSTGTDARYKIIRSSSESYKPYYDPDAGCRFLPQASTVTDGAQVLGGHLGPLNCAGPSTCYDLPEEVMAGKAPTFLDVQVDASYENRVMIASSYDVCYCDENCLNSVYWFKAGTLDVEPVVTRFTTDYTTGSFGENPAIVNTGRLLVFMGMGTDSSPIEGSWTGGTETKTREMKLLRDDDGNVDKESCLNTPQPLGISGHRLVSGNTDYTEPQTILEAADAGRPKGQLYGLVCNTADPPDCAANIRISVPGWYAACYCDSNCNEVNNWAVFGRQIVAGPTARQSWTRYTGVTFSIDVEGYDLQETNRALILSTAQQLQDCGNLGPTANANGPIDPAILHTRDTSGARPTDMVWSSMGTEISFDRSHGLKDGDRVRLAGVNPDPADTTQAALALAVKRAEMFNTVHEVFVSCDDDATSCWKILIPVRFAAAEFPAIPNIPSVTWSQTSKETFRNIKVQDGAESPEGRGYIVCWCSECGLADTDYQSYVGQAGQITVKRPNAMPQAYLGLTTVMPDETPERGNPGGPVAIAFVTGDLAHYATATGQQHLVFEILPGLDDTIPGSPVYRDVLLPRTNRLEPLIVSADLDQPAEARQDFCGKVFIELWSEDPEGFPMPDGCYYSEDNTNPNVVVKQLHILFSPKNHLKKNTKYMAVTNMNVLGELRADFPADGAVWVWSMDDVFTNPFGVVEKGSAFPAPVTRVPPRDTLGAPMFNVPGDPRFDTEFQNGNPPEGFKIRGTDGALIEEMKTYCMPHDEKNPAVSPSTVLACQECFTEEDCGNGGNGVEPDPTLSFCRSPIDLKCPQANGDRLNVPAFSFEFKARVGHPIKPQSILRLWLHPLTQWDIGVSCQVAHTQCPTVAGGVCSSPICQPESVVGGIVVGEPPWPVNTLRIILPNIMADVTNTAKMIMKIGNLPLPAGGFFPSVVTAEIMKDGGFSPFYWDMLKANAIANLNGGSAMLYKRPLILAAALVSTVGDGNTAPFRGDSGNRIYARIAFGTTFYGFGNLAQINFKLPVGYSCATTQQGGSVPDLSLLANRFPSTKGRLGGLIPEVRYRNVPATPDVMCQITLLEDMIVYARTIYFVELVVDNPATALKKDDVLNRWMVGVVHNGFAPAQEIADRNLSTKQLQMCSGSTRKYLLCLEDLGTGYSDALSVLGKLSDFFIAPLQYGVGQLNTLSIFFLTEQEVGSLSNVETEVWVDAPSGFDFGQYCSASPLNDLYYIPEGRGTQPLPTGVLIPCVGAPTSVDELTFNRAKLSTTGRLLRQTFYGFQVQVTNAASYLRTQLNAWRLWTYVKATGNGVDGSYETARVNERVPAGPDTSWGMYRQSMAAANFGVSFSTSRPTTGSVPPADITVLPIIASFPTTQAIRVTAPAGYEWDFEQVDFRYQAPGVGVNPLNVVEGAEADIPISGKPARPNSEPKNVLTMDYMQLAWTPGVKYGFACKIRIPMVPPTGSANQFTIEFGYNQDLEINRLEAGTAEAPTVQRLINGAITYTTSIIALAVEITFSVRSITTIPEGGGLVIIGPPNFLFQTYCQPKPATNYPELPYDSTCLYSPITATGEPKIEIIAGPSGIPSENYQFSLAAVNPPQVVPLSEAGQWTFLSYELISEEIVLDQNTTVPGYAVARPMVSAGLVMWPKEQCTFITLEERAIDVTLPETFCDFEHWQFYPPRGYRDDRPNRPTQLIFKMQLNSNVETTGTLTVRAPVGYVFDAECRVVTEPSSRIFNDSAVEGTLPRVPDNVPLDPALTHTIGPPEKRAYAQRYDPWPTGTATVSCLGRNNEARITLEAGLELFKTYLFRLAVLRNPPVTPEYNYFLLEYNGEASLPFLGVNIWAFGNTSIVPTTTAASRSDFLTTNEVTIQLRPVNPVPNGGHVRVTAPSGFQIPTECVMSLAVHESEMPNISAYPPGTARAQVLQWAEFMPSDLTCQGDQTASSRGRLLLTQNNKYMRAHTLYVLKVQVINPQTTSAVPEEWHVQSYEDLTVNNIIDESYITGFVVNTAVQFFAYLKPESTNALVKQRLDFNMSFPETVAIGDQIQIVAPVSYLFSDPGDRRCPQYVFLDGAMTKTIPTCSANIISWHLMDESIPALSPVRFMVQVQNPPRTPTINLFQVRQVDMNGTRKSSRMLEGYEIVPELASPVITQDPSSLPCRIDVNLVTGLACEGTGSFASAVITFTATRSAELVSIQAKVGDASYDFTNARFGVGIDGPIVVTGRSQTMVVIEMMVHNGVGAEIAIHNIQNPMTPGQSTWAVTTYIKGPVPGAAVTTTLMPLVTCTEIGGVCGSFPSPEARRDEGLNLLGPVVLGYIRVDQNSFIEPIYYGVSNALVTFELRGETQADVNDVLVIRRPPGYTMTEGTLRALRSVSFGENGLDFLRKWSTDFANPEDFYAVLTQPVPALSTIRFQLGVASPVLAEKVMNWYFKTWRVQPLLDEDGALLDASMPEYPWLGREITATGTSDGAFLGFLLVGQVPFSVVPSLQTPGAEIKLTINLGVADGVEAQESVRMEVLAPDGFVFADSCRYGGSPIFSKCTGFQNQATLVTARPRLRGSDITVDLRVRNPGLTPTPNYFYLSLFQDESTQYVRWSQYLSYEIMGMGVVYKGNNQLAEEASGYFTFTPVRPSPAAVVYIVVTPPPGAGFRVLCTGISPLGFIFMPNCESGAVNEPLSLRFNNASLEAGKAYTVGVRVLNPGGRPSADSNYWGISLQDHTRATFDANLRIPGLELKSIPITCNGTGWTNSDPRVLTIVLIQIRVLHEIPSGTLQRFVVRAPEGIMFNEDPAKVSVLPKPLPLRLAIPTQVAGDLLSLYLDEQAPLEVGTYNIRFEVSNPTVYPHDNTWSIFAMKDITVEFVHVMTGYYEGQVSPFDINIAVQSQTSGAARSNAMPLFVMLCVLLLNCVPHLS